MCGAFESYAVETCLELLPCRGAESVVAMEVQIRHTVTAINSCGSSPAG
ncbi:MAG: hypothetical protein OXF08_12675 [Bacteroidetes bacterium]|nr:hypothetical protein [Bacteroidota bacterium]